MSCILVISPRSLRNGVCSVSRRTVTVSIVGEVCARIGGERAAVVRHISDEHFRMTNDSVEFNGLICSDSKFRIGGGSEGLTRPRKIMTSATKYGRGIIGAYRPRERTSKIPADPCVRVLAARFVEETRSDRDYSSAS